jgi:hypothetical protein
MLPSVWLSQLLIEKEDTGAREPSARVWLSWVCVMMLRWMKLSSFSSVLFGHICTVLQDLLVVLLGPLPLQQHGIEGFLVLVGQVQHKQIPVEDEARVDEGRT